MASRQGKMTDAPNDELAMKQPNEQVIFWLNEIRAAKKRDEDFRKDGQKILDIYSGKNADTTPFNILFSNTETLLAAFYSQQPRPVVQRRFKDDDPLGKAAALAGQRLLEFHLDTNIDGHESFHEAIPAATLDGLLPGRGSVCVQYDAEIGQIPGTSDESAPYKAGEMVRLDTQPWDRSYYGYAKKWSQVPWKADELHIDKPEATRLFGSEIANRLVYTTEADDRERDEGKDRASDERDQGERKTVCIYQIWDKDGDGTPGSARKVRYVCEQYQDDFLKVEDDPLGLTGFFNCPRPLQFVTKANDLRPTALYTIYSNQAKELNRLTQRINRLVEAIKAKGVYDTELGEELKKLTTADDNELIPADKSSSLAAEKGLQNAIWFMPIEQLVNTLTQLYAAREQCKRVIYEITGISDIIRGSTVASETATAQNIKSQWGTLRIKRPQREVQRYVRDLLRMILEVAATKFSEETWAKMTGLPFLTTDQRKEAEALAQAAREAAMQGQHVSPDTQQKIQADMAKPVWGQVLAMLRDDMQRAYRIDIETNSTIEPEAAEDQKQIGELMTAVGQFLNGVTPLVVKGALPFGAAKSMLLTIARRFRFGTDIEEEIKAMQAPQPEGAEDAKLKQAEMQQKMQESQLRLQEAQLKIQAEQAKAQTESMKAEIEMQKMQLELDMKREEMALDMALKRQEHAMKMEELQSKHAVGMAAGRQKIAQLAQPTRQPVKVGR